MDIHTPDETEQNAPRKAVGETGPVRELVSADETVDEKMATMKLSMPISKCAICHAQVQ